MRDFINRLLNDEIKCNLIDDDFEAKYFPKLYEMEAKPKKSFYNKERYEKNKDEILKNRREKYRTQHNKDLVNIKVFKGSFTLYFD